MSDWSGYFLRIAQVVAQKSKDPSTKVGCVVTGPDHEIRSTGYNDLPRGVNDKPPERRERPAKYMWTAHAEENAIAQAARSGVSLLGGTLYCTHHPCAACTRMIIQAGIKRVVCLRGITQLNPVDGEMQVISYKMFQEAGVVVYPAVEELS